MRSGTLNYTSDGIRDYCPGADADVALAKRVLAKYCECEGIQYVPFNDFQDVVRVLRQDADGRAEE